MFYLFFHINGLVTLVLMHWMIFFIAAKLSATKNDFKTKTDGTVTLRKTKVSRCARHKNIMQSKIKTKRRNKRCKKGA